jgi:2-keto-4-pentenoate hydratase/2-oxohepta-3-ene-1,7-dioic acid hydratase in catechol pathway
MKLVLYWSAGQPRPGLVCDRGVVDISGAVVAGATAQATMQGIIDRFEPLRPALEQLQAQAPAVPLEQVHLLPPLPRPGKILACIANYQESDAQRVAPPLNMFMKNPDAVIGPGDVIRLPEFNEPWCFMHEAELALVFRGPAKNVKAADWRSVVFGYTGMIDVTARGEGRMTWKKGSWLGKSFDTFAPLGPCIVTADEIPDPNDVHVQFWNNGQLRHDYNTGDMVHKVPQLVEFATTIMTMHSGDLLSTGTNHEGLGFLQDGERIELLIHGIGGMQLTVADPLKRQWERGVYMGADSTNRAAVQARRATDASSSGN